MAKSEADEIIGKILNLLTVLGVDAETDEGFDLTEKIRDSIVGMANKKTP